MRLNLFLIILVSTLMFVPSISPGKDLPKIAVWDLAALGIPNEYAKQLTQILASEIDKLRIYEVYCQENVRTLAGWQARKMQLGCTDTKCLKALRQMDIAELISGTVGKLGETYTVSLSLFDTRSVRAERKISELCSSENELIGSLQQAIYKLLELEPEYVGPLEEVAEVAPEPWVAAKKEPKPGEAWKDPITGMEFVFVKGGCFEMGDTFGDGETYEKPVHEVCVSDFYMGKYEVTLGEFRKFLSDTGYMTEAERGDGCWIYIGTRYRLDTGKSWRDPGFPQSPRQPVVCVSWNDSVAFSQWLSRKSGREYRLPTEAEWEYAARSGGKRHKYSWGAGIPSANIADESLRRQFPERDISYKGNIWGGYDDGYIFTAPVGTYEPNELGLHDMTGNACEWVVDWYDDAYYRYSPKNNPTGPASGQYRVHRGGSWDGLLGNLRASARPATIPSFSDSGLGFRLAVSPLQPVPSQPTRVFSSPSFKWPTWKGQRPSIPSETRRKELSPVEVFRISSISVYTVMAGPSQNAIARGAEDVALGSAVAVSQRHLITNCHIFENRPVILIKRGDEVGLARLLHAEPGTDRCYLETESLQVIPVRAIRRFNDLTVGERVYSIGSPAGLENTLGEGLISGLREGQHIQLIQTSAPISPGSSGGGLFDSRGNLIGITTLFVKESQNLNFAIAAEDFWK